MQTKERGEKGKGKGMGKDENQKPERAGLERKGDRPLGDF